MSLDDENESIGVLALESALLDGCEVYELIEITRGRLVPDEFRSRVWHICLGGGNKFNKFSQFEEIFDLPEQELIRTDCKALVDKLGNEEEDKISIICDTESVFTHYCKSRHLKYVPLHRWADILTPLLSVKMPRDHIYVCFEEILEKYIPRETGEGAPIYHLLRLILLYHDPKLSTFLDSRKITPDLFACSWLMSLFSSVCSLDAICPLWDIYFQERDPFYVLFLALVILVNAREQIMEMTGECREKVIDAISSIPSALSANDVSDFCSLARYYVLQTPCTFKNEFSTSIFGSVYMGNVGAETSVGDLPLSQALCLPVSAEEILETSNIINDMDKEHVQFFLVDCRPSEQFNSGHLNNALHLDSSLMLQHPTSFQTAVQGLFMAQRQAVASGIPGCGKHLCFIGSGREIEDQYVHMVVASFLQRNSEYVSLAKGGYQALHDLLVHNLSENLSEHDNKKCIVCCPDNFVTNAISDQDALMISASKSADNEQSSFINKVSFLSSSLKTKSADLKEKLVDYITNPSNIPIDRHVNPNDKGTLYRNLEDVFSIHDDDDVNDPAQTFKKDDTESLVSVNISQWLKKSDVIISFKCHQVKENGYMLRSHIVLTDALLVVVREVDGSRDGGHITARRALLSIMKITSRKKNPNIITLKYGTTLRNGDVIISDMDRFLISKASEATKAIKQQIMKIMQTDKDVVECSS